jgi:V8-like Glu-specific endopeptidase
VLTPKKTLKLAGVISKYLEVRFLIRNIDVLNRIPFSYNTSSSTKPITIMAIFNNYYPVDYYSNVVPEIVKQKARGTAIVCAVGQDFLDVLNNTLRYKTTGYYYQEGGYGVNLDKLCDNIAKHISVWVTGTAFAIHERTWMTPKHVVEEVLEDADKEGQFTELRLMSGFYLENENDNPIFGYTMYEVEKVEYHKDNFFDVCRITTKQSMEEKFIFQVTSKEEQNSLKDDTEIMMVGYPLGQAMKYTQGKVSSSKVEHVPQNFQGYISYFTGNSGSPVMDISGKVLGMLTGGAGESNEDWAESDTNCYTYKKYPNEINYHATMIYGEHFEW